MPMAITPLGLHCFGLGDPLRDPQDHLSLSIDKPASLFSFWSYLLSQPIILSLTLPMIST